MTHWYQAKGMKARRLQDVRTDPLATTAFTPTPQKWFTSKYHADPLQLRNPMAIRVHAKARQRITIMNLSNDIIYIRRIRATAKRHLETVPHATDFKFTTGGTPTAPVLYAVGDELTQLAQDGNTYQTPAGNTGTKLWEPSLIPYTVAGFQTVFGNTASGAVDQSSADADNFLAYLRVVHAKDQFQPWVHPMRFTNPYNTVGVNVADTFGGTVQLGTNNNIRQVDFAGAEVNHPGNWMTGSNFIPSNTQAQYIPNAHWMPSSGTSTAADTLDTAGLNNFGAQTGDWAWMPGNSLTDAGSGTQTAWEDYIDEPNAAKTQHHNLDFKEHRRGIIDRYFKRRSYVKMIKPGKKMTFSEKAFLKIAPVRMGIYGYVGAVSPEPQARAFMRWCGDNRYRGSNLQAHGSTGLGFFNVATFGEAGPALLNGTANTWTDEYKFPRAMYCKKTDPFGSPATTVVNTLVFRGARRAKSDGSGGGYSDAAPGHVLIQQTYHWAVKLFENRDPARRRHAYEVTNYQTSAGATGDYQVVQQHAYPVSGIAPGAHA